MREKIAGVYAIFLVGTRFVYIGESEDIFVRWKEHSSDWVWPNEANYEIIRRTDGLAKSQRRFLESETTREFASKGYVILSNTEEQRAEMQGRKMVAFHSRRDPDEVHETAKRMGRRSVEVYGPDARRKNMIARHALLSPEERLAWNRKLRNGWAKLTTEERRLRTRPALLARLNKKSNPK